MRAGRQSPLLAVLRKGVVSGLMLIAFAAYAIHDQIASSDPSGGGGSLLELTATRPGRSAVLQRILPTSQRLALNPPNATEPAPPHYSDGLYTGAVANAFYGLVQVQASVRNGQLADAQFLIYPDDRITSVQINNAAMPALKQEAIQAQSAYVNVISGATLTSEAFAQSLDDALSQAQQPS